MSLSDKVNDNKQLPPFRHRQYRSANIGSISTTGLTLEKVLQNESKSPFSLKEFAEYLEQTYCTENLAFYLAVNDYARSSRLSFGASPESIDEPVRVSSGGSFHFLRSEQNMLNDEELARFNVLKVKFEDIMTKFILNNAPQEVNIPHELRQELLHIYREGQCYHPAVLRPACIAVVELMRISAFIPFATDPNRLLPRPSKTSIISGRGLSLSPRRLKSTPSLIAGQQPSPMDHLPPLPASPLSPKPSHESTSSTIFKKLTTSFRLRARSQSPPRHQGCWRQINIPDPHALLTSPAAPAMERGHSNSSASTSSSAGTQYLSVPPRHAGDDTPSTHSSSS